jgi:hypothetical protein
MMPRAYARIAGILWLVLAFGLLLLTLVLSALASTAFVLSATMGIVALTLSALLFVWAPARQLFMGSTVLALMFALVGVAGYLRSQGTVPATQPVTVFVALSTLLVFVSIAGARTRT